MLRRVTQGTSRDSIIFAATVVFPEALPPHIPTIFFLSYTLCNKLISHDRSSNFLQLIKRSILSTITVYRKSTGKLLSSLLYIM